jgi:hypothetical protein
MIRPGPVLAIAARDLRSELAGRQGKGLPIISLVLLLPVALLGGGADHAVQPPLRVQGDVPAVVAALPMAEESERGTRFLREGDRIAVEAYRIPDVVRSTLDGPEPTVVVEELAPPLRIPGRTLLLALVSASTLTGAVAGSIGGERARHTLQALLSAAVTRWEIVLGKWLAWTGFGTVGVLIACAAAVLSGRAAPGSWLLAMPVVPGLTVAIGLWLVRRTTDVVAGTSVSLRVMPAVLGATGLGAWILSGTSDVAAALVPLGGALLVAGDLWEGAWLPTTLALGTSTLTTLLLLGQTARDLEEQPGRSATADQRPLEAIPLGLTAAGLWATVVPGPVVWGWAGNPGVTEALDVGRGLLAGSALLLTLGGIRFLRELDPARHPPGGRLTWTAPAAGLLGALALTLPAPTSLNPWLQIAAERLAMGVVPTHWSLPLVLLAQELWFRGWIQARAGWIPAALAWTVAICPHDPLTGLATGLLLGWAARDGLANALAARVLLTGLAVVASLVATG